MKKLAKKPRKKTPQPVAAEPVATKPVDMAALRGEISNQVCAGAVQMVSATIQEADEGHYQAMKCLFEMIGLFPAPAVQDVPQEDSLAGMLLTRLGIRDETVAEVEPGNQPAETVVMERNNVK